MVPEVIWLIGGCIIIIFNMICVCILLLGRFVGGEGLTIIKLGELMVEFGSCEAFD